MGFQRINLERCEACCANSTCKAQASGAGMVRETRWVQVPCCGGGLQATHFSSKHFANVFHCVATSLPSNCLHLEEVWICGSRVFSVPGAGRHAQWLLTHPPQGHPKTTSPEATCEILVGAKAEASKAWGSRPKGPGVTADLSPKRVRRVAAGFSEFIRW